MRIGGIQIGGPLLATLEATRLLRAYEAMELVIVQQEQRGHASKRQREMLAVVGREIEVLCFRVAASSWFALVEKRRRQAAKGRPN